MAARSYPPVAPGTHSPDFYEPNRGTHLRHPTHPRIVIPQTRSELTGPVFPYSGIGGPDADLTRQHAGEPIGERIILHGRVLDEDGRPVPHRLDPAWQWSEELTKAGPDLCLHTQVKRLVLDVYGLANPLIGFVVAFAAAFFAVRWLVRYLERHGIAIFGWYRLGVAAVAFVLIATNAV